MTAAMSKEDAAKELGVEVQILENIMRIPDENGAPIIRRVVPLIGPLKRRHRIAQPDLEQFGLDHISIRELAEQVHSMDQKLARAKAFEDAANRQKSVGEMFVDDEKVKSFLSSESKRGRVELNTKATLTLATTNRNALISIPAPTCTTVITVR